MTRHQATRTLSIKRRSTQKLSSVLLSGILVAAALIAPVQTIFAADFTYEWSRNNLTGTVERQWEDVASSSDGMKLVAVARDDMIYTSSDGGNHWVGRESSGVRYWSAVASSADGSKLVAVASLGYIYTSADSGATWTEHTDFPEAYWSDVAMSADGSKIAASQYDNRIYTMNIGSEGWTSHEGQPGQKWAVVALSADGTQLVAGDDGGYIYTSINGGSFVASSDVTGTWNSLVMSADGSKLLAVSYNDTFYTSDAAVNDGDWTAHDEGIGRTVKKAAISADGSHMAVVGQNSPTFVSVNGGAWTTLAQEPGYINWSSIAYSADGARLVGTLYYTTYVRTSLDNATTWSNHVLQGTGEWLQALVSDDGNVVVMQDGGNGIQRSVDGGVTWTFYPFQNGTPIDRLAMSSNGMKLIGADFSANSIKTSNDGGQTWVEQVVTNDPNRYWSSVAISDDGTRLVAIEAGTIHVSTDDGDTWQEYASAVPIVVNELAVSGDAMTLVAKNYQDSMYFSTDGGETWSELVKPVDLTGGVSTVAIAADGETILVGAYEGLYLVSDQGSTWTKADLPLYAWNNIASSADGQTLIAAAVGHGVWVSSDAGVSWRQQEIHSINDDWGGLAVSANGSKLFADEYGGYVYQGIIPGGEEETPPQEETPIPPVTQPPASSPPSTSQGAIRITPSAAVAEPKSTVEQVAVTPPAIDLMKENTFRAGDEYMVDVVTGQVLSFQANDLPHTFTVDGVQGDTVTFTLRSTPQTHTLRVGETGNYDVDSDNVNDISVTVNRIVGGMAELSITKLAVIDTAVETKPIHAEDTKAKPATNYGLIAWIAGGVAALLIVILIIRKVKRA